MKNDKRDIVVYGSFNDTDIVFLEKSNAEYYAEIHRCHKKGITFGDLHKRYPWFLDLSQPLVPKFRSIYSKRGRK